MTALVDHIYPSADAAADLDAIDEQPVQVKMETSQAEATEQALTDSLLQMVENDETKAGLGNWGNKLTNQKISKTTK